MHHQDMSNEKQRDEDLQMSKQDLNNSPSECARLKVDDADMQGDIDERKGELIGDGDPVDKAVPPSMVAGKEIRNTIVLAISLLCVFTSYGAIQSLQGSLNDEGGLGVISLGCLYGANIVSSIMAPMVVAFVGVKRVIIVSFAVHFIYVACNFYPSFATLVPASVLLGAITGPLWSCQGIYLTTCAFSYAQETGIQVYAALSRINGIFWAVFDLSNVIGNLVMSSVLYQGHYNVTKTNISDVCGINDCPSEEVTDIIADPEPLVVYILLGIFLGCVLAGILTTSVFLTSVPTQGGTGKVSIEQLLFPLFKMIARTDMKYLLPLTIYLAIAEEICFAELTKSFVSCPIGIQNVGYVMMAYGLSTSVSGFVFSRIAKYTTRYVLLSLACAMHLSLLIWIYHWSPTERDTILIYVLTSVWGIGDGLWKTQYNALLGTHFADHMNCVFAAAEGVKSIGFTATFIYSSLLCMHVKLSIAISFLIVGMALYYFVEIRFIQKTKRRNEKRQISEL